MKSDGRKRNDCERNAAKRLLTELRREPPHLALVVEDGLASNGPHIRLLKELDMRFVLGAKPGDHKALFEWVEPWEAHPPADPAKRGVRWETVDGDGTTHCFRWLNGVPLNDTHFDLEVNFLDSRERRRNGKERRFSWVTDLRVEPCNAMKRMRAGRARWRIENETFNTLKNQGDEFEHNFGHGEKNLATVFAALMMLAFAIDQVRKMCCALFRAALARKKRAKYFRRDLRALFMSYRLPDWETLYRALAFGHHAPVPVAHDTSQARRRAASRSQPPCRFRESTSPPAASGPRPEGRRCPAHSAPEGCAGSPDIRTLGGNRWTNRIRVYGAVSVSYNSPPFRPVHPRSDNAPGQVAGRFEVIERMPVRDVDPSLNLRVPAGPSRSDQRRSNASTHR